MPVETSYLKKFSCFRDLPENQLEAIAQITNAVCYPAGYTLFEEGKHGDRLFFIAKGNIEVLYNIGESGRLHVDTVSGEEIIGCSALVEPYVYTATERSLNEVEVLEIDADALQGLMKEDCSLGFSIQQQVIRILMDRIINLRLER